MSGRMINRLTGLIFWIVLSGSTYSLGGNVVIHSDSTIARTPLKIKGSWPVNPPGISEIIIRFEDTLGVMHLISRLLDEESVPVGYTSHIETPVCSDTLCNIMDIRMYWSLAGTYWGYDTIPGKPLTKNDHLDFDGKDYQKLHELLLDEQSILRRRHKEDLFDKVEKRVSNVVDAVTGATAKEVKDAVVDGAVYSSFTIYHLVHSQLAAVIREDVRKRLLPGIGPRLVNSDKVDERIFFFRELDDEDIPDFLDKMLETIPIAVPRDRLYLMKKIPKTAWSDNKTQVQIANLASELDIHSLSHFLNQLRSSAAIVHPEPLRILSKALTRFSLNQLRTYLALLEKGALSTKDPEIGKALKEAAANPDYSHRSFLEHFLTQNQQIP